MSHQEQESIILIVEDDETNAEALALIISSETPYQPFLTSSGEDAIKAAEEILPALLLIDYNLPGMDGIEAYERIRAIPGLERVPAIFLSATVNIDALKERNLTAIEKPYDLDTLLSAVETHLMPKPPSENSPPVSTPGDEYVHQEE